MIQHGRQIFGDSPRIHVHTIWFWSEPWAKIQNEYDFNRKEMQALSQGINFRGGPSRNTHINGYIFFIEAQEWTTPKTDYEVLGYFFTDDEAEQYLLQGDLSDTEPITVQKINNAPSQENTR